MLAWFRLVAFSHFGSREEKDSGLRTLYRCDALSAFMKINGDILKHTVWYPDVDLGSVLFQLSLARPRSTYEVV